jgi:hypothetical protein
MSLFSILVNIEASTARLESGLDQATRKITEFSTGIESTVKRLAGFAGIALSVDAVASSLRNAVDAGDRLQLLSDRMGASVASLSRLQYAAALTDVPVEALTSSLDHFHEILTRAEVGSGRAGKALAAMGIDAKKLLALPFEQQLEAISDRLSKIPNPAKRAGLEMILFGEAGAKLDPLLRQGAAGIQRLADEADKAGVTIDGGMTEKLKQAHEEMVKADAVFKAASVTIAASLAPAIEKVAGWLSAAVGGVKGFGEALAHYFNGADTPVGQLNDKLTDLTNTSVRLNKEIFGLEQKSQGIVGHPGQFDAQIARRRQEIEQISAQIKLVTAQLDQAKRDELTAGKKPGGTSDISKLDTSMLGVTVDATKIYTDKMDALMQEFTRNTETSIEREAAAFYKQQAELDDMYAHNIISAEEYKKRMDDILDSLLPGIEVTAKQLVPKIKAPFDEIESIGDKAAKSLQGAFANFLFNPFHGGAKRMAADFLEAMRKMAADAAAADLFKKLFGEGDKKSGGSGLGYLLGGGDLSPATGDHGWLGNLLGTAEKGAGSWLSGLLGGGGGQAAGAGIGGGLSEGIDVSGFAGAMAGGGEVSAGSTYLVGEDGPELFTASSHGNITPNSQLGDVGGGDTNIHMGDTHIDARGADAERIMTVLPPILAAHAARTKAEMLNAFRRNGLAAPARA